ncbi:MAG: biotin--[acetyl-CoA-carboxylase] ligase [Bacteroidaceae bacterium]
MVQIAKEIGLCRERLKDVWPELEVVSIPNTTSTNQWMRDRQEELRNRTVLVITDFQTSGRGSGTNHWESQKGMNLIFSLHICPFGLAASQMFALSEAMSLGVCMGLKQLSDTERNISREYFRVKWPNDVYYSDGKICGMLIENDLMSRNVASSIMGVGININQNVFLSEAPNPISLRMITGHNIHRMHVLENVIKCFRHYFQMMENKEFAQLHAEYLGQVYRWQEWHRFADSTGEFEARIVNIQPDGHLILNDSFGKERKYAFGEIRHMI